MQGITITTRAAGGVRTIVVAGELDANSAPDLDAALGEVPDGDQVHLDMRGVTFTDSMGLRSILLAHRRTRLVVLNPSDEVHKIFEIAGIADILGVQR